MERISAEFAGQYEWTTKHVPLVEWVASFANYYLDCRDVRQQVPILVAIGWTGWGRRKNYTLVVTRPAGGQCILADEECQKVDDCLPCPCSTRIIRSDRDNTDTFAIANSISGNFYSNPQHHRN